MNLPWVAWQEGVLQGEGVVPGSFVAIYVTDLHKPDHHLLGVGGFFLMEVVNHRDLNQHGNVINILKMA